MIIILSYIIHFRMNIFLSITLFKLAASSSEEKKPTSRSNVADHNAFCRSSVLIETPVSELYATLF